MTERTYVRVDLLEKREVNGVTATRTVAKNQTRQATVKMLRELVFQAGVDGSTLREVLPRLTSASVEVGLTVICPSVRWQVTSVGGVGVAPTSQIDCRPTVETPVILFPDDDDDQVDESPRPLAGAWTGYLSDDLPLPYVTCPSAVPPADPVPLAVVVASDGPLKEMRVSVPLAELAELCQSAAEITGPDTPRSISISGGDYARLTMAAIA
jgi:hypothetical protein